MRFEYDPRKSAANRLKHGIDFEDAQRLWDDEAVIYAPARSEDEPRFIAIGAIDGKLWTAIWAERDRAVRIISVRRAREGEARYYQISGLGPSV